METHATRMETRATRVETRGPRVLNYKTGVYLGVREDPECLNTIHLKISIN